MDPTTDPRDGAADRVGRDPPEAGLAPNEVPSSAAVKAPVPKSGQLWRHYRLTDQIPGGPGWCFNAINMEEFVGVVIRVYPVGAGTEARRAAWKRLKEIRESWMPALVEAREEDGLRYEVSRLSMPTTLREWRSGREAGLSDFEALVRQLSGIVQALHDRGLVHLNLRSDTLHVDSIEGELKIHLGGLELATLIEQANPIAIPVDPFYAPPEAVGLEMQPPGRTLCAWDWWSVGRVVQEFVLGRHIYGELLQIDLSKDTAGSRSEAEVLLSETGDYQVRAGAVELMPPMCDLQISLLRGLLATARVGRWGFREVQRWLERRLAKDRYDSPGNERFFVRADEVRTVPETAEYFSGEENWREGEANIFNSDDPASFACFVEKDPGNYDLYMQLKGVRDLEEMPEWRNLPQSVRRSALAGLAWAIFAGPKVGLRVRGLRMTHYELETLVHGAGDSPALGRALLALPYLRELQMGDPEAASMLSEVASGHAAVLAEAVRNGWISAGDGAASERILILCLDSAQSLQDALHRLRCAFVGTRNPAAQALLASAAKERNARILLAYAESCPERFGFFTQEAIDRELYERLRKEGERIARALFWLRLRAALASNPLVYGSWTVVVASLLVLGAFAWITRLSPDGCAGVVMLLAVPAILRLSHWSRLGQMVEGYAAQGQPWLWNDGIGRCQSELSAALPGAETAYSDMLSWQLGELNWEIAEIPLKETPQLVAVPGRLAALWATSFTCWIIMLVVFGCAVNSGIGRFRADGWIFSAHGFLAGPHDAGTEVSSQNSDWSFGDPRRRRIDWDLPSPAAIPKVDPSKVLVATPDQVAYALVEGERELMDYRRNTVKPLIAVRVPSGNGLEFILFDGRDGTVAERHIYLLARLPPMRTCFELDKHKVVYLGTAKTEIDARQPAEPADPLAEGP